MLEEPSLPIMGAPGLPLHSAREGGREKAGDKSFSSPHQTAHEEIPNARAQVEVAGSRQLRLSRVAVNPHRPVARCCNFAL